jgi:outer membrane protein OmpA-like peptidoglycan-associated protein
MRCLRLVSLFVVLCAVGGTARADFFRVTNPSQFPVATPIQFGNVAVGANTTATVSIAGCNGVQAVPDDGACNTGGGNSTVAGWTFGAGCGEFVHVPPPAVPVAMANGAANAVTFTFRYTPTGRGTDTCVVTTQINAMSDDTAVSFTLTGTGIAPELVIDPTPIVFADTPVNLPVNADVTLHNPGENQLTITSLEIVGANKTDYAFTNQGCANQGPCTSPALLTTSIASGGNAVFGLRCTPSAAGARVASLQVVTNDPVMGTRSAALTCTGEAPDISIAPTSIAFGNQRVGTQSAVSNVTVANAPTANATLTFDATVIGADANQFALACAQCTCMNGTCSGSRAPNESLELGVRFAPTTTGDKAAQVQINSNDFDEAMLLVDLTGTGTQPAVTLIAPAAPPLELGNTPLNVASAAGTITIENTGNADLTVTSVALTGGDVAQFAIATGAVGAHVLPATGADRESWTVTCTPTSTGLKTTTLRITHDAPMAGSTTDVGVRCTGTVPDVDVAAMLMGFGNQRVGTTSAAQTFTVDNLGLAPMAYTISSGSADFTVDCGAPTCTGTLAAAGRITVSVRFAPGSTGTKMTNITIATPGDPDEMSTTVMVTGTGVEPAVTVDAPSPAPLAIGDVDVGASGNGTVTIRNTGTSDLAISGVTLVGGDAAQFSIGGSPVGAQTLTSTAGMNSRSWTVTCTPATIGAKSTTLRITHDAPAVGTQTNVAVTCTGRGAIFTPSVVAPAVIDFGQVQVGMPSAPQMFTLTNTGNKAGRITMLTSTVNVFAPSTMANLAMDIAPGGSITVQVVFTPADSSVVNGSVCGVHNGLGSPSCVGVTGDGASVGIDVAPAVNFGDVRFDAAPRNSGEVTIRNIGESVLRVDAITSAGAPFTVVAGPTLPVNLALGETRTFRVRLTPTMALGTFTRQISVNGVFTVGGTAASASIQATARIVAPEVSMTADTIDFGMFDIDDPGTPVTRTIMITNTAPAATGTDLNLGAPVLVSGAPSFSVVSLAPATVAPGGSAMLTVRFAPTSAGEKTGQITITIDALTGMTYTVTLRGLAIDQNVMCTPATIMFPDTVRRQTGGPRDATITNLDFAGNASAAPVDYTATITGADAADFAIGANASGTVAGNSSKALPITFTPAVAGARAATLVVTYTDDGTRTCMINLSGTGRLRNVSAAPMTIDFGTVATGASVRLSEVASPLRLTSTEPAAATATTVRQVTVSGTDPAVFTVVDAAPPRPLPTNGSVDYDIVFSPSEAGMYEADIDVFFDEDPEKQLTVRVVGRAVDVDLRGGGCDAGGGGAGAGALVGLAALGLLARRRRAGLAAAAALGLALAATGRAEAQSERGELDISTFTPAASTDPGLWNLLSPLVGARGALAVQLSFHHDAKPLVAEYSDGASGVTTDELVTRRTSVDLGLAYAITRKLELGVELPLHSQDGVVGCTTDCMDKPRGIDGASGVTLGDIAVRMKANLAAGSTSFGASLAVTAPTAKEGQFAGSRGPTAHLQALVGLAAGERVGLVLNGGLRARQSSEVLGVSQGTEMTYGAGAMIRAAAKIALIAEAYGSIGVVGAEGKVNPTQFALGLRYRAGRSLFVGVGGGGGMFGQSVGSPEFRGFASVALVTGQKAIETRIVDRTPPPPPPDDGDDDGDGVANSVDKCRAVAEDKDGFDDADGCPDLDNDGDGLNDVADKCPNEPEDKDRWEDNDGCVDADNDEDGIADTSDKCPFEPEDKDGFNDNDGCDDPDNDNDGIIDVLDQCALEPEVINGNNDDDGCPDTGDPLYMVMPDRIEALEPITFTGKTAKLTKGATGVLNQIAQVLRADQSIKKIRVTVHVHPRDGGDQALSDSRAKAIRDLMLKAGVEPERLEARGIGSQRPLVKPSAKGAEQINDRVEFIIMERRSETTTPKATPPRPPTPPTPPKGDAADSLN